MTRLDTISGLLSFYITSYIFLNFFIKHITMACLNCYPRTFTPNAPTDILYRLTRTQINTRYMKDSLPYRGSILWNTVSFNEHGVSQLKKRELKQPLKTKYYLKDLKFNVVSVSTVRHRGDNFLSIKTIEFMLAGVNMFWTRLRLILARAIRRGLK